VTLALCALQSRSGFVGTWTFHDDCPQRTSRILDRNCLVWRLDRRQTTRHVEGAVAASCLILARADLRVVHMKLKSARRFFSCSGQSSGRSGRVLPRWVKVLRNTRQNRSTGDRSIHIKRSALAIRLSQVAEWPPSKIH